MTRIINPLVADYMVKSSKKLFNAATSGDPELAEATLLNIRASIDSYILAIKDEG
jgi:hypothetical protein